MAKLAQALCQNHEAQPAVRPHQWLKGSCFSTSVFLSSSSLAVFETFLAPKLLHLSYSLVNPPQKKRDHRRDSQASKKSKDRNRRPKATTRES